MIERLLNSIFWIDTAFTRSRHPEVEEFRQQQRVLILASVIAVGSMLLALFIAPSESVTSSTYAPLVTTVLAPFSLGLAGISVLACLVAMWSAYCLSKYDTDYR